MTRSIPSALGVAALISTGLVYAQQQQPPQQQQQQQQMQRPPRAGMRHGMMGGRMAQYLNLTPEQQQQMRDIRQQARTEAQPYMDQLRAARTEIVNLIKSGASPDAVGQRAQQLTAANANAIQELAAIKARTAARMYNLLTPEQKDKAIKMHEQWGQRGGPHHGFGPFGPGF